MADAERWAAGIPGPAYAIDDETAIKVTETPSSRSSPRGTGNCSPPRDSGLTFADRGSQQLKGVPGTWQLYTAGQEAPTASFA